MDPELVEVLNRGEAILERAQKVSESVEERTRELIRDGGLLAPPARGRLAPDAPGCNSVRSDGGPASQTAAVA